MSVEIAWVERSSDGFVVRRSGDAFVGRSFVFNTTDGQMIFVVSAVDDERISDAEIVLIFVSSLIEGGAPLPPAIVN